MKYRKTCGSTDRYGQGFRGKNGGLQLEAYCLYPHQIEAQQEILHNFRIDAGRGYGKSNLMKMQMLGRGMDPPKEEARIEDFTPTKKSWRDQINGEARSRSRGNS